MEEVGEEGEKRRREEKGEAGKKETKEEKGRAERKEKEEKEKKGEGGRKEKEEVCCSLLPADLLLFGRRRGGNEEECARYYDLRSLDHDYHHLQHLQANHNAAHPYYPTVHVVLGSK